MREQMNKNVVTRGKLIGFEKKNNLQYVNEKSNLSS